MSFAATISSPKAGSGGPAVLTHIFPPQGQIFPADTHPGLVSLPGSQSVLETPAVVSPGREPCGRAVLCLRRDRISIPLGRELGGEAAQDFANRHPTLGFDWLRHGSHHAYPVNAHGD